MGIRLDKKAAADILVQEAALAETKGAPQEWVEQIEWLSQTCENHNVRTHIAFLGTAILAKATDRNIDPFSVKTTSSRPGAYSARGLGHNVLVPYAVELGIDLGTRGREPLNNQPYLQSVDVSSEMRIREAARPALEATMQVLSKLARVATEEEARSVLRAFIKVRRSYRRRYPEADHGSFGISYSEFADDIQSFVLESSEGGKRAQAIVAGLLAARFGSSRIASSVVNDPDRNLPGDVGLRDAADADKWAMLFEVRDKPVTISDIRIFAEKTIEAGCPRAGMVAVGKSQPTLDLDGETAFAARHGLLLIYFEGWFELIYSLLFWDEERIPEMLDAAHSAIYEQLVSIEATVEAVEQWNAIRR